jgi:hypothetical protein
MVVSLFGERYQAACVDATRLDAAFPLIAPNARDP